MIIRNRFVQHVKNNLLHYNGGGGLQQYQCCLIHCGYVVSAKKKKGGFEEVEKPLEPLEHPMAFLDVFKDSSDVPMQKPDSEYPEWLWTIDKPKLDLKENTLNFPNLSPNEQYRTLKQFRRVSNWVKGGVRKRSKR